VRNPAQQFELSAGHPGAADALFIRYGEHVRRVLVRVLNFDPETQDLVHDVFVDALQTLDRLKDPKSLRSWIAGIAVFKARHLIRQRRRRQWLRLAPSAELDRVASRDAGPELTDEVRCTYDVLNALPVDERIVFVLHVIDGMELMEIADMCRVSIATTKRRLWRAKERFARRAQKYPILVERLRAGSRWTT
jgi:RNA polymerase sigma-70 factor (ECF subfamily)